MHAISSYRGNRPTHTHKHPQTHRQDWLQYTVPQLASMHCNYKCKYSYFTLTKINDFWKCYQFAEQNFSPTEQDSTVSVKFHSNITWCRQSRDTQIYSLSQLAFHSHCSVIQNSLFGHVVRLDDHTPAHSALSQVAAAGTGPRFGPGWWRRPGRLRHLWIQQIGDGTPFSIHAEWSKARRHGHSGLTQRTSAVHAIWWWWSSVSLYYYITIEPSRHANHKRWVLTGSAGCQ